MDGSVQVKQEFNEALDEVQMKMGGVNTLRLFFDKQVGHRTFTFNFPLRCSFKGIVDPINNKSERHMSVGSFIYIKGESKSAIIALNHETHSELFTAFYGMITKTIINYEELKNGHSFFGVVFHNNGFSLENYTDGHILQAFAINTNRKIESLEKLLEEKTKNDKKNSDLKSKVKIAKAGKDDKSDGVIDLRYAAVSWENFVNINNDNKTNNINNKITNFNEGSGAVDDVNNKEKHLGGAGAEYNENNDETEMLKRKNPKSKNNNNNKDSNSVKSPRRNVDPYKLYYKLFKKTVVSISKLSRTSAFISSFNMHFIYKLYIGSWAHLNFFEIAYQGNEMNEFFIRYKMGQVSARPISDFNLKKGLNILIEHNNFFEKYRGLYGTLWKPVMNPLVTDTRYREDLLWLMRFYEIVNKFPENNKLTPGHDQLDLYEKIRLEAFLNAGKWKEVLETFTHLNISKKLKNADYDKSKKNERNRK